MSSRATELVNDRAEPLKGGAELLKSGTALLRDRAIELQKSGVDLLKNQTGLLRKRATELLKISEKKIIGDWGETIVNVIFGLMMVSLAALFTLLYTGVLTVG